MFTEVLQNDANSADVEFGNEQRKIVQILQILTMLQHDHLLAKIGFDRAEKSTYKISPTNQPPNTYPG